MISFKSKIKFLAKKFAFWKKFSNFFLFGSLLFIVLNALTSGSLVDAVKKTPLLVAQQSIRSGGQVTANCGGSGVPSCGQYCRGGACTNNGDGSIVVVKLVCEHRSGSCYDTDPTYRPGLSSVGASFSISDVPCGHTAQYDVVINNPGNPGQLLDFVSYYGGECSTTPPPDSPPPPGTPPPAPQCPAAPSVNISGNNCDATQVTLSWGQTASAYNVRVDGNGASGPRKDCSPHSVCVDNWNANSMTVSVVPGNTYSAWVHPQSNQCPASPINTFSVPKCATPPDRPTSNPDTLTRCGKTGILAPGYPTPPSSCQNPNHYLFVEVSNGYLTWACRQIPTGSVRTADGCGFQPQDAPSSCNPNTCNAPEPTCGQVTVGRNGCGGECRKQGAACQPTSPTCGDNICDGGRGESCSTCPNDCGQCRTIQPFCGDNVCNNGEACGSCPQDCDFCPAPAPVQPIFDISQFQTSINDNNNINTNNNNNSSSSVSSAVSTTGAVNITY